MSLQLIDFYFTNNTKFMLLIINNVIQVLTSKMLPNLYLEDFLLDTLGGAVIDGITTNGRSLNPLERIKFIFKTRS